MDFNDKKAHPTKERRLALAIKDITLDTGNAVRGIFRAVNNPGCTPDKLGLFSNVIEATTSRLCRKIADLPHSDSPDVKDSLSSIEHLCGEICNSLEGGTVQGSELTAKLGKTYVQLEVEQILLDAQIRVINALISRASKKNAPATGIAATLRRMDKILTNKQQATREQTVIDHYQSQKELLMAQMLRMSKNTVGQPPVSARR